MKTWKPFALICIVAIIAVTTALFACKEDEPDPECECPIGTLHLVGETGCKSENKCNCEHNVPGARSSNGIPITDRTGIGDISKAVGTVNASLGYLVDWGYSNGAATLKKNVKEITVVAGYLATYNFATKTITIGLDATEATVTGAFADYLDLPGIVP